MTESVVYGFRYYKGQGEICMEESRGKKVSRDLLIGAAGSILATIFLGAAGWVKGFFGLPDTIKNMEKILEEIQAQNIEVQADITNLQGSVETMEGQVSELLAFKTTTEEKLSEMESSATNSSNDNSGKVINFNGDNYGNIQFSRAAEESFCKDFREVKAEEFLSAPNKTNGQDIFIIDSDTGEVFSFDELAEEKLLIPYTYAGQDIIFYGQFNRNNQWNGDCIMNVYRNGYLEQIMELVYDDGFLVSYRQVLSTDTVRGVDVWAIADRVNCGSFSSGETTNYRKDNEIKMNFNFNSVSVDDILTIDDFQKRYAFQIEAFYYGNISDGKYNDTTGTSYLVKYAEDGTVRMLYVGNLVNGKLEDHTGNAWYIVREEDTDYIYYRGRFSENTASEKFTAKNSENHLTRERIEQLIRNLDIKCDLNWYDTVQ